MLYRASFRENHLAFSAMREDDSLSISEPQSASAFIKVKSQVPRSRNSSLGAINPLERIKCSHLSLTGSPFGSRASSPCGSLQSSDSLNGSRRLSMRSHVSDTRRRLIDASCDSARSTVVLEALSPKDTKELTSSEDNDEEATAPIWLDNVEVEVVEEEKYFTSPTKSKIHFLKCISSQRSLLGANYVYGGANDDENKAREKEEDDAIDFSLKEPHHREVEGDGMFLEDFLARHYNQPLEVDVENMDAISDCTDDENF